MSRPLLFIGILLSSLVTLSSARCIMCPNCDYDIINDTVGAECLQQWTCDDASMTMSCYYQSSTDPSTYNICTYTITEEGGTLLSGPSVCEGYGGIDSKCGNAKDIYYWGPPGYCIAASGTVPQ
ncbi:hypothetical protein JAAARDRAFT_33482 [Jaapia argillacea MUCL 33604]|uniref:Uncharacterized protein n=1 Tax=Jaapia argillacea MUCL 33604 TaxID=933084 RepID=A0A067QBE7_9AGAM|nr:hypothetical protein JAAARDRAFT_33482 [Jaapia argillacea MUCL 33604]